MARALGRRRLAAAAAVAAVAVTLAAAAISFANPGVDDPTPPAGYVLVQTLSVAADGTTVTSMPLTNGVAYKIRASGTVNLGSGLGTNDGDAEFVFDDSHTTVLDVACGGSTDIGLGVNGAAPDWATTLSPTHNYTIDFAGTGAAVTFQYVDCAYGDNSGSLTVRIFAPQASVAVSVRGLTATRAGRGVTLRWRTGSDPNLLGFDVYRQAGAHRVRLTRKVIPARSPADRQYSYVDRPAPRARSTRYWLQLIRDDGSRTWYGPVRARS